MSYRLRLKGKEKLAKTRWKPGGGLGTISVEGVRVPTKCNIFYGFNSHKYGTIVNINEILLTKAVYRDALAWWNGCIMTYTKKQINSGVKNLKNASMSWSQVCKALSGIGGYIQLDDKTKVRPLELMQQLGVHVLKNSYKPSDIVLAWSRRMMTDDERVCIAKNVPVMVDVCGTSYKLCDKNLKTVYRFELARLVSANDRIKGTTDVIVNTQNVLRGLQQSVYVDETMKKVKDSAKKVDAISEGFINMGTSAQPDWQHVTLVKGVWMFDGIEVEVKVA